MAGRKQERAARARWLFPFQGKLAEPPSGAGWPVVGWHLGGGDLRPAHFVGMHAQQFIPFVGALLAAAGAGRRGLRGFVALYTALWVVAMANGLDGAVFTPPPMAYGGAT